MIVNCVAYEEGRRFCDLRMPEIREWLATHNGFVWVALRDPDADELASAQQTFQLPDEMFAEARREAQRPNITEFDDDLLFGVLKLVECIDGKLTIGELDVFAGPRFVLSIRTHSERHFLGVRERL